MKKIILDLCGGTGSWSKPYGEAGYTVVLLTEPMYDITKITFTPQTKEFPEVLLLAPSINPLENLNIKVSEIYGILAAPPCTEFSKAKGNRFRDFRAGMKIVKACMNIIWECRINGGLRFWALENPVGFLRQFLGKPHFTFEPYYYGSLYSKRTDIWGYFNIPKKKICKTPPPLSNWRIIDEGISKGKQ